MNGPAAPLHPEDITSIEGALAEADALAAVLRVIHEIAIARMDVSVFSAALCFVASMELERIYSSHPGVYPLGARKSKRQTGWADHVIRRRKVFVGEGPLEMAAAFDDQERMASLGLRSIINVPVKAPSGGLAVLNFGWNADRVRPSDVTTARFLGLVASAAFGVSAPAATTGSPDSR